MTHILHEDHLVQTEHWKRHPSEKNIHCLGSFKCDHGSENKGDMIIANSLISVASQWGSLLLCSRVLTRPRGPHSQPHWTHSTPAFMTQWRSQVSSCLAWDIRLVDACGAECTSGLESEWDLRPMSPTLPSCFSDLSSFTYSLRTKMEMGCNGGMVQCLSLLCVCRVVGKQTLHSGRVSIQAYISQERRRWNPLELPQMSYRNSWFHRWIYCTNMLKQCVY